MKHAPITIINTIPQKRKVLIKLFLLIKNLPEYNSFYNKFKIQIKILFINTEFEHKGKIMSIIIAEKSHLEVHKYSI